MAETFGEYVRRHRMAMSMTQVMLAERAGIGQSYVSGIERGTNREIDPAIVKAIAAALGRAESEALRVAFPNVVPSEIVYELPPDLAPIIESYNGLPEGTPREIAREQMLSDLAAVRRLTTGNAADRYDNEPRTEAPRTIRELGPDDL